MRLEANSYDEKDLPKKGTTVWIITSIFGKTNDEEVYPAEFMDVWLDSLGLKTFTVRVIWPDGSSSEEVSSDIFTEKAEAFKKLREYCKSREFTQEIDIQTIKKSLEEDQRKLEHFRQKIVEIDKELAQIDKPTIQEVKRERMPEKKPGKKPKDQSLKSLAGELLRGMKGRKA